MVVFRVEGGGVIKQCVASEDTMHILSFHVTFLYCSTSNRQNLVSCHAEVEKTWMIGALPVLIPGWEMVCVQAVCDILGVSEGGAQCTLLLSHNQIPPEVYHCLSLLSFCFSHPSNYFFSFIFFFLSFPQPHPSNLPLLSPFGVSAEISKRHC